MPEWSTPSTHAWRYDRVAFKASHNSYRPSKPDLIEQLRFHDADPPEAGCRGLELDIAARGDLGAWSVGHGSHYDPAPALQLSTYFVGLLAWSSAHPGHDVVTLTLDLKKVPGDLDAFPAALDAYVDQHLGRAKLFAPDELRKGLPNLRQGADAGWPSLGDLAGRFALCLSGRKTAKRRYALAPGSRACFADLDVGPDRAPDPTELDHRVILNANFLRWTSRLDQLDQLIRSGPWVLRAYYVNGDILWNAARSRQVALVATDNITHRWARIDLATARPFRALPPRGLG